MQNAAKWALCLQLGSLNNNVGEIKQMHFQRVQHARPRHYNLLGLLLNRARANESGHLLGRLPLGQLPQALLARPDTRVNDFQVQACNAKHSASIQMGPPKIKQTTSSAWVKYKYGAVNGFGSQIAFKSLVNCHTVDIRIINEPNNLIGEELA
jgi:hypothetical protein